MEDKAYRENLETLVSARTEQLRQAMSQNFELLEFLKRIAAMQSLEQIQDAVRAEIERLDSQRATAAPQFGREPGEPVPPVDQDDLKSLWQMQRNIEAKHPGRQVATGMLVAKTVCKPDANIQAVGYRAGMLSLLARFAPDRLSPWTKDGQLDDTVFRVAAKIPLQWMEAGVVRNGFPFDIEEFVRLCDAAQ